jgi:uncharacterized protein YjeT (DUF2065 family)
MSVAVLVLLAFLFLEGCLAGFAPKLVKYVVANVSERGLQVAGLIEAALALALLLLIYT